MKNIIWLVLVFMVSCNGQKKVAADNDDKLLADDNQLTLVAQDNYSGFTEAETLIIRDSKALKKFYLKVNKTRKPGLPIPKIDFTKELVLVYCSGEQNANSTLTLSISEVSKEQLIIKKSSIEKKEVTSMITSPFSVYKMPLTTKKISFKKER